MSRHNIFFNDIFRIGIDTYGYRLTSLVSAKANELVYYDSNKEIKLTYDQFCKIFDNSCVQNGVKLSGDDSAESTFNGVFSHKFSERFESFLGSLSRSNEDENVKVLTRWRQGETALNPEDLADIIQKIQGADPKNVPEINKYNSLDNAIEAQYFSHVLFPIYLFRNGYLAIPN